jgi:rRNA-processing protein EBP2
VTTSDRTVQFVDAAKINDDIQREVEFYNIANANALGALKMINDENIRLDRPANFYAEMFKNDEVMTKIRSTLVKQQVRMKNFEEVKLRKQMKRIQKQRKFEQQQEKVEEKKKNTIAINKWKADLNKRRDKDLDHYVKEEHKAKPKAQGKRLAPADDKFKNLKNKKQKKGKRLGKVARIKKRNVKTRK